MNISLATQEILDRISASVMNASEIATGEDIEMVEDSECTDSTPPDRAKTQLMSSSKRSADASNALALSNKREVLREGRPAKKGKNTCSNIQSDSSTLESSSSSSGDGGMRAREGMDASSSSSSVPS